MSNRAKGNADQYESFGKLLHEARVAAGKSVRDVAAAAEGRRGPNVSITLISLLEQNKRSPTYSAALKISEILSIDTETALQAAYRTRVTRYADMERKSIERFLATKKKLRKIDLGMLAPHFKWQGGHK